MKKFDYIKCKNCGSPLNKIVYGSLPLNYTPEKYTCTGGCCKTDYTYVCSNDECKTKFKNKEIFIITPLFHITLGLKKGFEKGFENDNK